MICRGGETIIGAINNIADKVDEIYKNTGGPHDHDDMYYTEEEVDNLIQTHTHSQYLTEVPETIDHGLTVNDRLSAPECHINNQLRFSNDTSVPWDAARIRWSLDGIDNGTLELAVGDEGTEEVVVRQYAYASEAEDPRFGTISRTLKLFNTNGGTEIPGNLSVGGNLTINGVMSNLTANEDITFLHKGNLQDRAKIRWRVNGNNEGTLELAVSDEGQEEIIARQYAYDDTSSEKDPRFGKVLRTLKLLDASGNTSIPGNLTVNTINGYKLAENHYSGCYFWNNVPVIPVVRVDGCMEIGKYIDFHSSEEPGNDMDVRLSAHRAGTYTLFKIENAHLQVNRNASIEGDLTVSGTTVIGNANNNYNVVAIVKGALSINGPDQNYTVTLMGRRTGLFLYGSDGKEKSLSWSETITHITNATGELGTFCESIGKIYDGYEKVDQTDCICQVQQSTTLNKRIVGIITSETQFASHGDCLVKVNSIEGLEVGDILAPDENGYGRKATDEEELFMMRKAIPRPKITSLDTGIEGMVACFIV